MKQSAKDLFASRGPCKILAFATQGHGSSDEARLIELLSSHDVTVFPFDRKRKLSNVLPLLRLARTKRFDIFAMEGTGVAGGIALLIAAWLFKTRFIVSSGDAVAPFLGARMPMARPIFEIYERMLYRYSRGFVGWSPYLVGRALTMGAGIGITAAGWAPRATVAETRLMIRERVRRSYGIPADALVYGIAGSLVWSARYRYCYGFELVNALLRSRAPNVCVLIVGDGAGKRELERIAGNQLNKTIFLPGRVRKEEVSDLLSAMDVGSLPQSVDGVGSFRYTTKLSEYLAAGLPFVTNTIPLSYDLDFGQLWRLPGRAPWDREFIDALASLMSHASMDEIAEKRARIPARLPEFDRDRQVAAVGVFISDVVGT